MLLPPEAAGLIEHLTQDGVGNSHGEAEPAFGLIDMLDVGRAGREPTGQVDFQAEADVEVVALTHEVQDAVALVNIQRHPQACGQFLCQGAVGANDFGRVNLVSIAPWPVILAQPTGSFRDGAHMNDGGNVTTGTGNNRGADGLADPCDGAA